jgi:pimeloyl-ACP methyl ester carboxylesterase
MKQLLQKIIPKIYGYSFNITNIFSGDNAAARALEVFSLPRKGTLNEIQKEYLSTARQQKIAFEDGLFMLYHWKGDGPTVLLNHGWESNAWRWKHLIGNLQAKGFNLIAIDAPAHGASGGKYFTAVKYSRIISTVMDLYEPNIVVAHSVGAMATIYQESQHQHACLQKLVLLGSPNSLEVIMRGYQKLTGFNNRVYENLNSLLKKTYGFRIEEFNTADFAATISVPSLIVHNEDDKIVPVEAMYHIAARMPQSRMYLSKTGGHSLHTDEVVEQVVQFLDS